MTKFSEEQKERIISIYNGSTDDERKGIDKLLFALGNAITKDNDNKAIEVRIVW